MRTSPPHTQAHHSHPVFCVSAMRCCEVLLLLLLLLLLLAPQERGSPSEGGVELQHPNLPGPSFTGLFPHFPSSGSSDPQSAPGPIHSRSPTFGQVLVH
ncbi:hypothetical protein B0H65DRAFT_70817 [Neurospora tetraspora]|uniref:Uncharacterized protein n=1 Tax=Neurospora tetraspora TaxID=94610 RepID=A0AAE0JRM2_9PEZI|nr:hypothetical protein B0H65DRAFT_70817 [Neurospora tetraspora]